MRLVSIGIGSVLVASVALNVWQWRREPSAGSDAHSNTSKPPPSQAVSTVFAGSCAAQLADVASRLAKDEERLVPYLKPNERFDRGAPDHAREAPIHDVLAKLFADAPQGWTWQLACRGAVCKLDVVEHDGGEPYDWMAKVQQGPLRDQVDSMSFAAEVPSQDPISKEPLLTGTAFMTLGAVETVSGAPILHRILARFHADLDRGICPTDERGYLSLQLRLDALDPHVAVAAGGTLAVEPVGKCMLQDLDAAIAAEPIPDHVQSTAVYDKVEVPPSDTNRSRRSDDRRLARSANH